ncbi:23S rRNA (guanosine(2251)-2'-O)-methyltransferase RlmB [Sphingopyxis sp. RIFCSPHIGHO2_12_FULL_65_19]|uniref:23S rRNA (guanosine(2251)-2'-O)-methyltransferase RlmB n=1 Tax=Sphingopyxis sp. RIFCSPHIGHO2_12_FULL_65_19 TaxID=1802172 RepID=UPI0008B61228|nr:23S rRNA (guanosine(2251)-2'-O)-methyltransferase RlmB [Sphingopyxis sp. RIFCSPHIGHO2_12_FULL_65_19]OHD08749.1 MAG: 23S rRNA (guanosine(2251)-2'-O)-methyltransferase RlmB [Sphingopyxis sp. RIFCSPHIGHO2_12_FULL_65_19]
MRQFSRHRRPQGQGQRGQAVRFWGRHAVLAALANPDRTVKRIWGTREALGQLDLPPVIPISYADVTDLARLVARDAPHQGLVIEVDPLDSLYLGDLLQEESDADSRRPLVILDQVTDPHNIGAVLRSAAAFDAAAIITQDRHSPPESGVIARSASGALETVPWVRVVNLSRALEEIAEAQYWRIGLMGDTDTTLASTLDGSKVALVLGSEGDGMRHNVMEHCDVLAKLPISPRMESLNISNAAAIALYAVATANA